MSNFMYVVIGAVVILVAGGILAGFSPQAPANGGEVGDEPVFFEQIGTIGSLEDVGSTSRIVDLGSFVVEETSPNATAYTQQEIRVRNDVFATRGATVEFDAFNPQKAYFTFIPTTNTNPDNLIVTVNGEELPVPDYASGRRATIPIPQDYLQRGSNVIRLEVEDPGLAFWRSPNFVFENVEVVLNDLQNDRVIKPFPLYQYERNGFIRGELSFFVADDTVRDRPLDIRMNGNPVATRLPIKQAAPYRIPFFANTSGMRIGENVLSFRTAGNSYYPLSNVRVRLEYAAGDQARTVLRDFTVSPADYRALGKDRWQGRLSFNVEQIFLERPLTIEFTDHTWTFTPTPGENVRTFDQKHVQEGDNTLRLTTDGSYRITDFNVSVVRTE